MAAPTVPENIVSTPRLAPRLMPESTSVGVTSPINWRTAITTQSLACRARRAALAATARRAAANAG
jgi:hypothetical protein